MPVAFCPGRALLVHSLCVFVTSFYNDGVTVMKFFLNRDLENRFAFLLDLIRNDCCNQVEWDSLDLLG